MYSQWPSWRQWVTDRWPAWPSTVFAYITEQVEVILTQMAYQACDKAFQSYYIHALSSWLGCMPDDSGTHLQVMTTAEWAVQEAAQKGPISPKEAYSCDLHILDPIQDSEQVVCMSLKDWHQDQQVDPSLSIVIARLWDGTLGQQQSKQTDSPKCSQFLWEWNHLTNTKVSCIAETDPGNLKRPLFS